MCGEEGQGRGSAGTHTLHLEARADLAQLHVLAVLLERVVSAGRGEISRERAMNQALRATIPSRWGKGSAPR